MGGKIRIADTAVIIAGGEGKRLRPLTNYIPKPMIRINNKPVLQRQIEVLKRYCITDIVILSGYKHEVIENYFGNGQAFGVNIKYVKEKEPLGTSGALKQLENEIKNDFLFIYGDIIFDIKIPDFINFHKDKKAIATLVVHHSDHPFDSDIVSINDESRIVAIHSKPHQIKSLNSLTNAAIYLLSPLIFDYIPAEKHTDFMKDIFPKMLGDSKKLYAYKTNEYIKDMGTISRLNKVTNDLLEGKA